MTRTESVRTALAEVGGEALVVLVHDAARPLVHDDVIGRVLAPLSEGFDGVVPALPVVDTLKRAERGIVTQTVERSDLVAVQTPQAFGVGALRAALAGDTVGATDCASLVERNGGRVRIVDGDPRLLKVTTRLDLDLVERLLRGVPDEEQATRAAGS
jgi:2-C-methyl-D-erythritol 4-phosphate cytidylyltransferase